MGNKSSGAKRDQRAANLAKVFAQHTQTFRAVAWKKLRDIGGAHRGRVGSWEGLQPPSIGLSTVMVWNSSVRGTFRRGMRP